MLSNSFGDKDLQALIVGCGNIGAGYDSHDPSLIQTHASAFHHFKIPFNIVDTNSNLGDSVIAQYGGHSYRSLQEALDQSEPTIVSLCTPTSVHFHGLQELNRARIPLIICEKPVVATLEELEHLRTLSFHNSQILVNYTRRFQPGWHQVKFALQPFLDSCHTVEIAYRRGLLNNGSHAFDLLEFLTDRTLEWNDLEITGVQSDAPSDDVTLSGSFSWGHIRVQLQALPPEALHVLSLKLCGDDWSLDVPENGCRAVLKTIKEEYRWGDLLKRPMKSVINEGIQLLRRERPGNFDRAVNVGQTTLEILKESRTLWPD